MCKYCGNDAAFLDWDWDCGWIYLCYDHAAWFHLEEDDDAHLLPDDYNNYSI